MRPATAATSVTVVCSPRPRVGRTLVARLLTDFYLTNGREVAAFDLNPDPDLTQFLPGYAVAAKIDNIKGKMALFDRLIASDGVSKVIDLGPNAFETFFEVAREIDFVGEAQRRSIAPAILFVTSPDRSAMDAYAKLQRHFDRTTIVPVHNEAAGKVQHRDMFPPIGGASVPIYLSVLAPGMKRYIDKRPFSFSDSNSTSMMDMPLDIHMEMQRWVRRIFVEFRELELRIMLTNLKSSLHNQ
ncbi:MAG: hypothetical protein WCI56_04020 [Hyphomicrobiales bacterium]